MPTTDLNAFRWSGEAPLAAGLRAREPLALAEVLTRTLPAGHAVARRLLGTRDAEALLHTVYAELWAADRVDGSLERWVRARTSELGLAQLRAGGRGPAAASVRVLADDLPEPSGYADPAERQLSSLRSTDRAALLRAHDLGVSGVEQGKPEALTRALLALAEPTDAERISVDAARREPALADLVLGLSDPGEATAAEAGVAADAERSAAVQLLRRGRRRVEGLPPTPDLATRLLAAILSDASAAATPTPDVAQAPRTAPEAPPRRDDGQADGESTGELERPAAWSPATEDEAVLTAILRGDPAEREPASSPGEAERVETEDDDRRVVATYTAGEHDDEPYRRREVGSRVLSALGTVLMIAAAFGIGMFLITFFVDLFTS